jgi:lipopolysaccharide heptosyltransferase II
LRWRILFAVIDTIGGALAAIARIVRIPIRRITLRSSPPADPDPQRILLVQLDHLGDAVMTTAMLPPLRRRYPDASIDVLASPWNHEIFRACPEINRVHVSRVNRFARSGRWGWTLATIARGLAVRRYRYDLAIDVRGEFPLALILWLSGARWRLGWSCGGGGFLLTDSPPFVPDRPEVESRLALLDRLGIRPAPEAPPWRPSFPVTPAAQAVAARFWTQASAASRAKGPRIVFHVGAGTPAKQWPVEYWRNLLQWTVTELDAQVLLVGAKADRIIADRILGVSPWPSVVDGTGRLSIVELAGVLQQAGLMAGADSGPAHLAAAMGTPLVALFSGTNSVQQWKPSGPRVTVLRNPVPCSPCHRQRCPLPNHPCMHGLMPQTVAEAIRRVRGSGFST